MVPPKKKPSSTPVSSTQKSYGGGVGISAQQVQAANQRYFLKRQQERAAQEQLYQQITRSTRPYTSAAMPQDGAIAYHAQALTRALIKRQAIDNGHARLVRQMAANQTYIKQGPTEAEKEIRRQNAIARKNAENLRAIMQSQPEATGIASGVIVGMAVSAQVVGPELAVARLISVTRWAGAIRTAATIERVGQGLSYQVGSSSGVLTWQGARQVAGTAAGRAVGDGAKQFTSGLIAHNWDAKEAYNEINLTSMGMAILPSDNMWHSLRNNVVGAGLEYKLNWDEERVLSPVPMTKWGAINFGQKVLVGLTADLISNKLSGRFDQRRISIYADMNAPRNFLIKPFVRLKGLSHLMLLRPAEFISTNTIGVGGGALSNVAEENIKKIENEEKKP